MKFGLFSAAIASFAVAACSGGSGAGDSRDELRIVGSSTVFPFAKMVAEQFVQAGNPSPVLESTGSGAGIELFCQGLGAATPDIANASRRMKASEFENCQANGVTDIVEVEIGSDGIVMAQSVEAMPFELTKDQIYRAVAANPYGKPNAATKWSDIDPGFRDEPINIYGPPSTSGTHDAFVELIMVGACEENPEMQALKESDGDAYDAACESIRTDGPWVDTGENDNLIIQKLAANPGSLGIFGYSYLEENQGRVRGLPIEGVEPTMSEIVDGGYPAARSLYFYVKKAHIGVIPGLQDYMREFAKGAVDGGYLSRIGLIPPTPEKAKAMENTVNELPLFTPAAAK